MDGERRLIAREAIMNCPGSGEVWEYIVPDPNAPSVREVVEAMRQAQVELFPGKAASKLGNLIARLEGE